MTITSGNEAKPSDRQHTTPCHDCPWRRAALPGWLGMLSAGDWLKEAHGENQILCHTTLGSQCAGAAIFRANICKVPRDVVQLRLPSDRERVFSWDDEFRAHHIDNETEDK